MPGPEELRLPDLRRAVPGAKPTRKIGVGRISRAVEEVSVPGLPEHLVMVNVGRPYRLEERLDGRVYRTFGVRGDVALIPAGTPTEFRSLSPERQTVESLSDDLGLIRQEPTQNRKFVKEGHAPPPHTPPVG
jgi:hypothetical protein